jgi:hypothetical protein
MCTKCLSEKNEDEFSIRSDYGTLRKQCKKCRTKSASIWVRNNAERVKKNQIQYYEKNKGKLKEYVKNWGKNNPDKRQKYCMSWRWNLRLEVIKEYGGHCKCCGENIPEFLTLDHINNDGGTKRKLKSEVIGGSFYRWIKLNGFPKDNFQLLCMNCNFAKGHFGGCPHND